MDSIVELVGMLIQYKFFFFNDTATTEIYTLSLHDALPISRHYSKPVLTGFICRAGYDEIRVGKSAHVINVRAVSSHYPKIGRAHV